MALNVDPSKTEAASLLQGIKITYDELKKTLAHRGIEQYDPTGQPFDPHQHEAVMQEASDKHPSMTVTQTFQQGYKLGDRILGAPPFIQPFPGSERALTLTEVQEMQTRLTKAGFDTGGTDGRVGNDTMKAVRDYQTKMGLLPADGYGGLKVLARLRQGG